MKEHINHIINRTKITLNKCDNSYKKSILAYFYVDDIRRILEELEKYNKEIINETNINNELNNKLIKQNIDLEDRLAKYKY